MVARAHFHNQFIRIAQQFANVDEWSAEHAFMTSQQLAIQPHTSVVVDAVE